MRRSGHFEHRHHERHIASHSPIITIVIAKISRVYCAKQKGSPSSEMRGCPILTTKVVPRGKGFAVVTLLGGAILKNEHASPGQPSLGISISLNDPMKDKLIGKPVIAVNTDADIVIGDLGARERMEISASLV